MPHQPVNQERLSKSLTYEIFQMERRGLLRYNAAQMWLSRLINAIVHLAKNSPKHINAFEIKLIIKGPRGVLRVSLRF